MEQWHYPRTALAEQYLKLLGIGISSSFALIAPRRKGKTLFILQDLAPLAQKNNYLPVYASLWQNVNSPHEGLIAALEDTIAAQDKKGAVNRLLKNKIKKTTVGNDLLGKMEVEFASNANSPNNTELIYLDQLLAILEQKAGKKTILLMIDEVQHLSTSIQFDPLAHTLRTMLDKRQGKIKSLFTGSSRHYMNILFNTSQSPFYHFVETIPFPDLGDDFLEFIKNKLEKDYRIDLEIKKIRPVFSDLDKSPYWMMKFVSRLITSQSTVKESHDYVIDLMEATEDFKGIADKMKAIDRLIFLALCDGQNLFSQNLMRKIDRETDVKGVQSNVQRSIKRLSDANLISQIHKGEYNIEKPGLKKYLNNE